MKTLDLLLIVGDARRFASFLVLARELAPRFRIGFIEAGLTGKDEQKRGQSAKLFFDLLEGYGAERVTGPVAARLALLSHHPYTAEQLDLIRRQARWTRGAAVMSLALAGQWMDFAGPLPLHANYVMELELYGKLIRRAGAQGRGYDSLPRVEVGEPFRQYPLFPEIAMDYLVALPTDKGFDRVEQKIAFLHNVCALIDRAERRDTLYLKPHNAVDEISAELRACRRLPRRALALMEKALHPLAGEGSMAKGIGKLRRHANRLITAVYEARLARRVAFLDRITPCWQLGLEVFLPGVRKGLITGRSNAQWHSLFMKVPVFNCDENTAEYAALQRPPEFQELDVPFCGREFRFDPRQFDKLSDSCRRSDLVARVAGELRTVAQPHTGG